MKFLLITLITHLDPAKTTRQRFREVVDNAETQSDIAPELRRSIPSRPLGGQ
jgi:hypothetical protein